MASGQIIAPRSPRSVVLPYAAPETAIYAARSDVEPPPGSPPLAKIKLMPVDYEEIAKEATALKKRFAEIYQ